MMTGVRPHSLIKKTTMTSNLSHLRISLLTPVGRGALAVVGLSGEQALASLAEFFFCSGTPLVTRPDNAVVFGRWGNKTHGEELVVVRRSQTVFEVHCHGGLAACEVVMADLVSQGAIRQTWKEWLSECSTPKDLCNKHQDGHHIVIENEAREAISLAASPRAAKILCKQLSGVLAAEIDRIELLNKKRCFSEARDAVSVLLSLSRIGLRLIRPWKVVVIGPANAGKSSLINALAGYSRNIVSHEPGTTRDAVETRMVLDGWEVDLIDTAGIREAETVHSESEKQGIQKALHAAQFADLVVNVQPSPFHSSSPSHVVENAYPKTICVLSKHDLTPDHTSPEGFVSTSTCTGHGIQKLMNLIVRSLLADVANQPELLEGPVPFTERQVRYLKTLIQT